MPKKLRDNAGIEDCLRDWKLFLQLQKWQLFVTKSTEAMDGWMPR